MAKGHTRGALNFLATYTDPLGNVTEYTRNAAGDVTQVDFEGVTVPSSQTASRTYTYSGTTGQLTSATDEEGKVTNYSYYASGDDIYLLEKVEVDPSGLDLETFYFYDGYWNVDAVTDPRGETTTYTYDALRRRLEEVGPSTLFKVKYEYDGDGRVTKKQIQNRNKDNAVVTANEWFDTTYSSGLGGTRAAHASSGVGRRRPNGRPCALPLHRARSTSSRVHSPGRPAHAARCRTRVLSPPMPASQAPL